MLGSDNAARCRALRGFENESIDHIRVDLSRIFNSLLELASLDFAQASEAYERALKLAPGNAGVLDLYGRFSAYMGRADAGIAAARPAVTLDPLNPQIRRHLGYVLTATRRY